MSQVKLTGALVEGWLKDIGSTPKGVTPPAPESSFQYEFDYPKGTPHRLIVLHPIATPRALVVLTQVSMSPEHLTTFKDLEDPDKIAFLQDLGTALNREFVEYGYMFMTPTPGALTCPTAFQVSATRFDDGLSLDSFARTVSSVYKTEVAGITCVQKHLQPGTFTGGGGNFDFKRSGGLQ